MEITKNNLKEIYSIMRRRIVMLVATIVALASMSSVVSKAQSSLGVSVAGVAVTKTNAADLVKKIGNKGSGKISYDIASHTLTLEGETLPLKDLTKGIETTSDLGDFTIELKGKNVINTKDDCIRLGSLKNVIKGEGSLTCVSSGASAISIDESQLSIEGGCVVDGQGSWGVSGTTNTEPLTVKASTLKAQGEQGSITDLKEISLEDCVITAPVNAKIIGGSVVLNDALCTEQVVIEKVATDYDIVVKGTKVNATNAANVLGDGSVVYLPDTKTLLLRKATLDGGDKPALETKTDLYIVLEGENSLSAASSHALVFDANVEVKGEGSLKINSKEQAAIKATKDLTVREPTVVAEGVYGFLDDKNKVTFTQAKVELKGSTASLSGFGEVVFEGCHIHTPEGAEMDGDRLVVNGVAVTEQVVIGTKKTSVDSVEAAAAKVWATQGELHLVVDAPTWVRIYSLDGVCLRSSEEAGHTVFALPSAPYMVEVGKTIHKILVY